MPAQTVIKHRRGTAAEWIAANPVLAAGEFGLETDTGLFKYGNGTGTWTELQYPATSQVVQLAKNDTGASTTKGQAVYISGANGANALFSLADADTEATSSKTIGLLAQDLDVNGIGPVITDGLLSGINTSAATIGQSVWLSETPGGRVYGAPPAKPAHSVYLGVVTRVHAVNGEILVKVQNGYELGETHDVNLSGVADNDLLAYDAASSMWTNQTAAQAGLATASHTHAQSDITNLSTDLAAKAPLDSPALTGTPTAPTAPAGKNTTQIATTAFVQQELATLVDSAPATLNTLNELAAALGDDANFATTVTNSLATKAPTESPTFTGTVTTPLTTAGYVKTNSSGVLSSVSAIAESDVTNLVSDLAGKASVSHTHAIDDLTDVQISSPTDKQVLAYEAATAMWKNKAATGGVTATATAPSSPLTGDAWFDTNTAKMYVYYDSYWVEVGPGPQGPAGPSGALIYGSSASRTTALPTPGEGQLTYLGATSTTDTANQIDFYNGSAWESIYTPGRNAVINGAFDFWQRNTSYTLGSGVGGIYTADRFTMYSGGSSTAISRVAGPTGFQWAAQFQPAAGNTSFNLEQRMEYSHAVPFIGQTVTLSFWIYIDNPTGFSINVTDYYPPALDNWSSATFVPKTTIPSTAFSTGSWQRISTTFTASNNSNGWGLVLVMYGAASKTIRITGIQIELGSVATPFRRAGGTIAGELAACQRYYRKWDNMNEIAVSSTNSGGMVSMTLHTSPFRAGATLQVDHNLTNANYSVSGQWVLTLMGVSPVTKTGTVSTNVQTSTDGIITVIWTSATWSSNPTGFQDLGAAYLAVSAEL